jgi:hypothetical protein
MKTSEVCAVISMMLVTGIFACRDGGSSNPPPTTPPATYSISGMVTLSGAGLYGATVTLDTSTTITTDATGIFTFSGLKNGTYSITPTRLGYEFTPKTASITISGASVTGQNFTSIAVASTPFPLRGFNITDWGYGGWNDNQRLDLALQFAQDEGANMVVMDWVVHFNDDGTMVAGGGVRHPPWEEIRTMIAKAKARGFYLILKPHITMTTDANNRSSWNTDVSTFLPSNFFPAWQQYLNNLGTLASANGVDAICIGTENNFIDCKVRDDWAALIKSLRSNFSGAVTYDSLFNQWSKPGSDKDIRDVVFWDLVDFIACSFYVTLTQDDNASVDTLRQLLSNNPYGNDHDPIGQLRSISEKYGKQIVTLEGGYESRNGGLWYVTGGPPVEERIVNNDLQARGLEAWLWALNVHKQNWLKGCSVFEVSPQFMGTQSLWNTVCFGVYGKPAANNIKKWFSIKN